MNSDLNIRSATSEDCALVFPLAKEMAMSFKVDQNEFEISFHEILSDNGSICLVAEKDGEVIGYLIGFDHRAFYANGRVSWVEEIFVKEKNRKEGAGKCLMDEFEFWCMERGSKLIGLATRRASGFYEAISYEDSATFYRKLIHRN
jgi:GNAT superfamily N-acetyltransferase